MSTWKLPTQNKKIKKKMEKKNSEKKYFMQEISIASGVCNN